LVVAARNALPALLDELAAADQEIARLQDVAAASQRLFGVKVARVEIAFDDELTVSDIVVIATCPGGDEPQIARLVGQRLEKELQSIADARREKRLEKLDELDGSKPGEDEDLHVLEVELLQEQLQTRYFSGPDRRRIARLLREVLRRRANASGKES
ncbi:MAG TPA: hypothetical protein VH083_11345, partial [Myxococcales bacterium]|nr:hypothetical protein [Myxococcales bacterium]